MSPGFVHLRVHTEYSLVDSVVRIGRLMDQAVVHGTPAVALTDESNLFALVKFYRAAMSRGIKPIVGADVWVAADSDDREAGVMTLLCQNRQGYLNLSSLITDSYSHGQGTGRPTLQPGWLTAERTEGLIAFVGPRRSAVAQALNSGSPERAETLLSDLAAVFPDRLYIEVQRIGVPGEKAYLQAAVDLGSRLALPLVATNDVRFLTVDDFEAHEARVCIHQSRTLNDTTRPREYSPEQYLKTPESMQQLFADLPEALANSVEIAKRCNLEIELGQSFLPAFPTPDGAPAAEHLRAEAWNGLKQRLSPNDDIDSSAVEGYHQRLERELGVICRMGFEGYFLIVADFIRWARQEGIPVGPGRGSGAGSLVAYSLGITDLDPLEFDLLFERFLNPERVSMPDFDIDFCIEGRDRVIEYVTMRYGKDRVSQIITYGSMAARAVVRDVGRVLGHPFGFVDRIAKLIPFEIGMTLEKALTQDEELRKAYENEDEVRALIDLAKRLEGLARNAGKHAGGVVISPTPLTEFTPLYREADATGFVTQLDKDDVEAIGLVKFDFLGLKTLTVIDKALDRINAERLREGLEPQQVESIPMGDEPTYELLRRCNTTAVFQLESRGMRDLIKRLQPDQFDDVVALVALFRPGPLQSGMVDDFIDRKHGRNQSPIDYLHPSLETILKPTYGVILYQEQVMQIAQVLAGYSLGDADILRRAMGKKKPEEMAKQRSVFLAGAEKQSVNLGQANHIFDLMEKFAGYGFNKSHSAAYALIAYQTAYLKAHYPEAFMAAVMSADMDHTDKLVILQKDCRQMGIELVPPSVNRSEFEFSVDGPNRVVYGLGAIKGVGRGVVEAVVAERQGNGLYKDLVDFCSRVDGAKLNRRALEAMIKAGALDGLAPNRASLLASAKDAMKVADHMAHAAATGQTDLFGTAAASAPPSLGAEIRELTARDRLAGERESLGLYLTGHPFDEYREHCRYFTHGSLASLAQLAKPSGNRFTAPRRIVTVAGLVADIRRRGNRLTVYLDDDSEQMEVTFFEDSAVRFRHLLAKDGVLVVKGTLRFDDFIEGWRLTAQEVCPVDEAIENHAKRIIIHWGKTVPGEEFVAGLKQILRPYINGNCDVCIEYQGPVATATVTLGEGWLVKPTRELRDQLNLMLGDGGVSIHYPKHGAELFS